MKRRNMLLGGTAAFVAPAVLNLATPAFADGTPDPNRLNGDLMPLGGERAGNAAGTIPAWTGGCVKDVPAGWTGDTDPYGDDKVLYSITAANMAQYADNLCDGQMALLKRFSGAGYRIDVYPTRRSACAPQFVYDNTFKNVTRAQPSNGNLLSGFTGAVGGMPFPIPSDDPAVAGIQLMWNHGTAWRGSFYYICASSWIIGNGTRAVASSGPYWGYSEYNAPDVTPENYTGVGQRFLINYNAPANIAGGKFLAIFSTVPDVVQNTAYEYLVGEGRIREEPQVQYDVPIASSGDAINYDEANVFLGKLDRYNWKLIEKKEMIIPYNCYKHNHVTAPEDMFGLQFLNPNLLRYELHRCYVVEATLRPGARMSEPRRRFYIDEDTGEALMGDCWDDQGNLWKHLVDFLEARPDLPGVFNIDFAAYNLQEEVYSTTWAFYDVPQPYGAPVSFQSWPKSMFTPQTLANSGGL
jgi:hypothetical protein